MIKEKDASAIPININIQKRRLAFFFIGFIKHLDKNTTPQ